MKETTKIITDPKAPERLRGKRVVMRLNPQTKKIEFEVDVPDDVTQNELGYLRYIIGEFVDGLREKFPDVITYNSHFEVRDV